MIYSQEQLKNRFFCTFSLFFISIFIWKMYSIVDITDSIDYFAYAFFNSMLDFSSLWAKFVGIINHKSESWINLVCMLLINALIIFQAKKSARKVRAWQTLYFWFFFQFVILLTHLVFQDLLEIRRLSPSIVNNDNHTSINALLATSNIKETSASSFPAGHTLVAIYWCLFSMRLNPSYLTKRLILIVTVTLCCNRLFTGAHWLTDVLFTVNLGFFFHYLSCHPTFYRISDLTIKSAVAFHPKT